MESDTITVNCDLPNYTVDTIKIRRISEQVCDFYGTAGCLLGISFVDAKQIRELNSTYRQKNMATDVLSFPQSEFAGPLLARDKLDTTSQISANQGPPVSLGDLVICLEKAEENAKSIGQSLDREVCFLIVHGLLHLFGHDHEIEGEEKIMLEEQQSTMTYLESLSNPPPWHNSVQNNFGA